MTVILNVDQVVKKLGRSRVLDGASLTCASGEITALYGANGAGKSTLLQVIVGVLVADRGAVSLCGQSIVGRHVRGRRHLGYVPEAADPPQHLTVNELLAVTSSLKQAPPLPTDTRVLLGIDAVATKLIGQLSLGERRRACLGAALVGDPKLLVLDEPTNGLDDSGVEMLAELLERHCARANAVLLATHDRQFTARVNAIELMLRDGVVLEV